MQFEDRLLHRMQRGLAVQGLESGQVIAPLPRINPWHALRFHFLNPFPEFVEAVYRILLDRAGDELGRASFIVALEQGMPRAEMIHILLQSEEAKRRQLDTSWLDTMLQFEATEPFSQRLWLLQRPDPDDFIERSYLRLLARKPRPSERKWGRFKLRISWLDSRKRLLDRLEHSRERRILIDASRSSSEVVRCAS